jgi:hypothetical protein
MNVFAHESQFSGSSRKLADISLLHSVFHSTVFHFSVSSVFLFICDFILFFFLLRFFTSLCHFILFFVSFLCTVFPPFLRHLLPLLLCSSVSYVFISSIILSPTICYLFVSFSSFICVSYLFCFSFLLRHFMSLLLCSSVPFVFISSNFLSSTIFALFHFLLFFVSFLYSIFLSFYAILCLLFAYSVYYFFHSTTFNFFSFFKCYRALIKKTEKQPTCYATDLEPY